jgi:hypothetical protein
MTSVEKTMPKRLQIIIFHFATTMLILLGRCFQDLSNGILQAPKFKKNQLVNLQSFSNYIAGWSKKLQWETIFFSISALKESWTSAYYWQCLLVRIGWSIL